MTTTSSSSKWARSYAKFMALMSRGSCRGAQSGSPAPLSRINSAEKSPIPPSSLSWSIASERGSARSASGSSLPSRAARAIPRNHSGLRPESPGNPSRSTSRCGDGKENSVAPASTIACPSCCAIFALTAAAWIMRIRCPMTAQQAASYGVQKQTGGGPGYFAWSPATTSSRCPTSGNSRASTSSERIRATLDATASGLTSPTNDPVTFPARSATRTATGCHSGPAQKARSRWFGEELSYPAGVKPSRNRMLAAKENGPVYPTSNVPPSACEIPPDPSAMDRDDVAIGILEGEGQPERTLEGGRDDGDAGPGQLVVKGAWIVRLEPECDAPAQVLDFREVD